MSSVYVAKLKIVWFEITFDFANFEKPQEVCDDFNHSVVAFKKPKKLKDSAKAIEWMYQKACKNLKRP